MDDFIKFRSIHVAIAMATDICINYPLWIVAKRLGTGLSPFPSRLKYMYKGGGILYVSLGPTVVIEDSVTTYLSKSQDGYISAALSGLIASTCIASQIERLIARSHMVELSIINTIKQIYQLQGLKSILLPPGMFAMAGREIPFATSLFYIRPIISSHITTGHKDKIKNDNKYSIDYFLRELLCGSITSLFATPISHVPNVIASYQQGHEVSFFQAIKQIKQQQGLAGFWNGLFPRTISLTGTFTIVPIVLEYFSTNYTQET